MYIEKDFFTIKNDTSNKKKRSTHHYFLQMKQKYQKTYGGPLKNKGLSETHSRFRESLYLELGISATYLMIFIIVPSA